MATNSWTPATGLNNTPEITMKPATIGTVKPITTANVTNPTNVSTSLTGASTVANPTNIGTSTSTGAASTAAERALNQNELTSVNVNNLINQNSPLMQQAATRAKQSMNGAGLLNSSMTVGAAQGAVMDRAIDIGYKDASSQTNVLDRNLANKQQSNIQNADLAQNNNQFNANSTNATNQFNSTNDVNTATTNAGLLSRANDTNAAATNATNQYNTNNDIRAGEVNASAANTTNQFNAEAQMKAKAADVAETNKMISQIADVSVRKQLADIEAQYKTLMQANNSAQTMYQQSAKNISEIMMNPDLTGAAKQEAVNNQNALLKTGMNIIGKMNNLDLGSLLVFPTVSATATKAK